MSKKVSENTSYKTSNTKLTWGNTATSEGYSYFHYDADGIKIAA